MKRKTFLAFLACLLCAGAFSQGITISVKEVSIEEVFLRIEAQTHNRYTFVYAEKRIREALPVTMQVIDATLAEALTACFKNQPLTYQLIENKIIVRRKDDLPDSLFIGGHIMTPENTPVHGATVGIKGTAAYKATHEDGAFRLSAEGEKAILVISCIGYQTRELEIVRSDTNLAIQLTPQISKLEDVNVVSTGYQVIPKERATGSFTAVSPDVINRRPSVNILDRLEGLTPGILFSKNVIDNTNQSDIAIRSRSTILANPSPLLIVDNFPYEGNLSNINPNDIEYITVLKDAAAASIWGAFSGNGVIVIKTKHGSYNQKLGVSLSSSVTVGEKPNLYYLPQLSPAGYMGVEEFLYGEGYYTSSINSSTRLISPVVSILHQQDEGSLTGPEAAAQLKALEKNDTRRDLNKYFYQASIHQQYALNIYGGTENNRYYLSGGYDKSRYNTVNDQLERISFMAKNAYQLLEKKLELKTSFALSQINFTNNFHSPGGPAYPYQSLADENGNPAITYIDLKQSYKDTAGQGGLLNWNYRPLQELGLTDNITRQTDYRIHLDLQYKIFKGFTAQLLYQYNKGISEQNNYHSVNSYYTRDLINSYSQVDPETGEIIRPVPLGGIMDIGTVSYLSHNIRGQLNYQVQWNKKHLISAIGGIEQRSMETQKNTSRLYGYDKRNAVYTNVDYTTTYPQYYNSSVKNTIPDMAFNLETTDHYRSFFINGAYTYKNTYTLSASARRDISNLFGAQTNNKTIPLWSAGASWLISREPGYPFKNWLPYLRLRATHGYTGNVDKSISALTTALVANSLNIFNAPQSSIINPPNDQLRWEKVSIQNIGLDFGLWRDRIKGSFEYYFKKGTDLIGYEPIDPTTGVSEFKGNNAAMRGNGYDITLRAKLIDRKFNWTVTAWLSHATDRVIRYKKTQKNNTFYTNQVYLTPLEGKPLYALLSYKWGGLDIFGDPRGYDSSGLLSSNYTDITSSDNPDELVYNGSSIPTTYGSVGQRFNWCNWELSFTILFKLGYYFRRSSVNYTDLYSGSATHSDYEKRWQQPGDERFTQVPKRVPPNGADVNRDIFYNFSEVLVEKGDHIRLQDIRLGYSFDRADGSTNFFRKAQVYVYLNNIGILWKATRTKWDPDYITGDLPAPLTIATGITVDF